MSNTIIMIIQTTCKAKTLQRLWRINQKQKQIPNTKSTNVESLIDQDFIRFYVKHNLYSLFIAQFCKL